MPSGKLVQETFASESEGTGETMTKRGWKFWKFILTTCRQTGGAPWIDKAWTTDAEGLRYRGWCIRPFFICKRPVNALVIGWRKP